MGRVYSVDTLDKGVIHFLARMAQDGESLHHITQNNVKFRAYKLIISGIFLCIFSERS